LSFFDFDGYSTDLAPDLSTVDDYLAVSKFDIIDDITVSTTRNARLIMSGDVYVKKSLIEN
jgi:hypothetical protein